MNFNPNNHMTQIKTKEGMKDYLGVQWRLVWFRSDCPEGTIETEMLVLEPDRETEEEGFAWNEEKRRSEKIMKHASGFAVFRAKVTDGKGGSAMGTKSEKAASFADYIEKAETGAIGRALAGLGYGTQFVGDELDEGVRIVDAPVQRKASEKPASIPTSQTTSSPSQTVSQPSGGENTAIAYTPERKAKVDAMYALCVKVGECEANDKGASFAHYLELLLRRKVVSVKTLTDDELIRIEYDLKSREAIQGAA